MTDDIVERLLDEHFEQVRREGEEDADDRAALARDALARIQHLETYAEECRRAYELSEAKFREAGKLVDRLRAALDRIACFDTVDVSLWNAKAMRDFARAALAGDAKPDTRPCGCRGQTVCDVCQGVAVPASASPNIAESNDRADAALAKDSHHE